MKTCKFIHYEFDPEDIPKLLTTTPAITAAAAKLPAPQWVSCDIRSLDMRLLGKFSVIMVRSTPLHSTPLHSTPLHSTPLHSTPLHLLSFALRFILLRSHPFRSTLFSSVLSQSLVQFEEMKPLLA